MLLVLNFFIRNTFFNYFLIVRTRVCFLALVYVCQEDAILLVDWLGLGLLCTEFWLSAEEEDRHMSLGCSQGSQHKNIKSPNTNFEPTEKLTNSKQDKNMGCIRYILKIRMWPECPYKIPHICIAKPTQKSVFFLWYCHQKMVWTFHTFMMQFLQFWGAT